MKPYLTIRRSGTGAQRAIAGLLIRSIERSRHIGDHLSVQLVVFIVQSTSIGSMSPSALLAPAGSLIERGLVEVRRGKGTFVTLPKITQELTELTGFVEDMQALGRTPTARLLDKRIVAADETVAHHLALLPGTLVVRLQRVRLADGVAMSFDETYLPRDVGEIIAENDLEAEPVFALLEDKYDTPLVEAEYKLEAAAADPVAAQALQVPAGSPIFLIERTPAIGRSIMRGCTIVEI
jgi:UTRA domain